MPLTKAEKRAREEETRRHGHGGIHGELDRARTTYNNATSTRARVYWRGEVARLEQRLTNGD